MRCAAIGVAQADGRPLGRQVDADLGHAVDGPQGFTDMIDTRRTGHPRDGENEGVMR